MSDLVEKDLDPSVLMWDIRRTIPLEQWPRARTVVAFRLTGAPPKASSWWLMVADGGAEVCDFDPGYEVAATISTSLRTLSQIWRGDQSWQRAAVGRVSLHRRPYARCDAQCPPGSANQAWRRCRDRPDSVARLLLGATAAAVPVLLDADRFLVEAETCQLRPLPQAALELGETSETRKADDVVPEPARVVGARQPADHRAEERGAVGRLEMQDRRADVATRQGERFLGLGADLVVETGVVERRR